MKYIYSFVVRCAALAIIVALSASCTKENGWLECPPYLRLMFEYTHNPDEVDYFSRDVNDVLLCFFDANGDHAYTHKYATSAMKNGNMLDLDLNLPDGTYTVVAWGNADESEFTFSGTSAFSTMCLDINCDANGEVCGNSCDLFHGTATVVLSKGTTEQQTIAMIRNTNDVTVLVNGLSTSHNLTRATEYSFRVKGTNGSLGADNTSLASSSTTYVPTYSDVTVDGADYLQTAFKTMRIQTTSDLTLDMSKDGTVANSDNLVSLIMTNFSHISTDSDFDKYYEYTFVYDYDSDDDTYTLVKIEVGDWTAVINSGGGI